VQQLQYHSKEKTMITNKSFKIKGHRKNHEFKIENFNMSGVKWITLYKDGNPVLKCNEAQWAKFKIFVQS
jgi:hypothetical protein